jgi:hypothetical protein
MFSMRKYLLFSLLLAACLAAEDDLRTRFLLAYYDADFKEAHNLLMQGAVSDPITKQIWDERIHAQEPIEGCDAHAGAAASIRAIALLRIGSIEKAREEFTDDWLSWMGKAMISEWESDARAAKESVERALQLQPDRPELLYLAGNVTPDVQESIAYFKRYLEVPSEDPIRKKVVENSIDFMEKTLEIPLNVIRFDSTFERMPTSTTRQGQQLIRGKINGKKDVSLLLDTGAGGITLRDRDWTPKVVTDLIMFGLGKKQVSAGKRLVLDHFESGSFSVDNPVAASTSTLPVSDIDGIISAALFSNYRLWVPLRSRKPVVVFSPGDTDPEQFLRQRGIKLSHGVPIPVRIVGKLILLKGRIKNSTGDMDIMLDTGAASSILSALAAKRFTRVNYVLSSQLSHSAGISGVGGATDRFLVSENVDVQIGQLKKEYIRIAAVPLADSSESMDLEMDMILGRDFLSDYDLLIDYAGRTVTFYR